MSELTRLPKGFRSHVINADALVRFADVDHGKITLPNGSHFSVLVLPNRRAIDLASLQKIGGVLSKGAVVLGEKPDRAQTLRNYPSCDDDVKKLADRLSRDCDGTSKTSISYGKGRIYCGTALATVLKDQRALPDFEYTTTSDKRHVGFIHRRDGKSEIYFVANMEDKEIDVSATFGSPKTIGELWHPEFGEVFPLAYDKLPDGRAKVHLTLGRKESVFVVFHDQPAREYSASANSQLGLGKKYLEIKGPWRLSFAPEKMTAPAPLVADKLFRLDKSDDEQVRHFSGYITYDAEFTLPPKSLAKNTRYAISLGEVYFIGEVWINGHRIAALWKPPYSWDITEYLHGEERVAGRRRKLSGKPTGGRLRAAQATAGHVARLSEGSRFDVQADFAVDAVGPCRSR